MSYELTHVRGELMNSKQKRLAAQVDEFIRMARKRGITPEDLGPHVKKLCDEAGAGYHADRVNSAGLAAQIHFLLGVKHAKGLRKILDDSGSVLDGFVQGYSSDPKDVDVMIGRNNIDENGDIL